MRHGFLAICVLLSGVAPSVTLADTFLIAHRGASHGAPENTLAAFRLAWEQGADGIEGDFRLTADGRIVCIHDETTRRTAGGEKRRVDETPLAELRALDAGGWKDARWAGERIPTIEEVLATAPAAGRVFLEVKCGPEILAPLEAAIKASGLPRDRIAILAFREDVVATAKERMPDIRAFWLVDFKWDPTGKCWTPSREKVLRTLKTCRADGLDCRAHRVVDRPFVAALRRAGLELHVWTVDDPQVARRFRALGADSITTNRPGWLRGRLEGDPPGEEATP